MVTKNDREEHINALMRSRTKLVEQRRALVKRDCASDRNEGYAERIVAIQAGIEATDEAISDERKLLAQMGELTDA
jgi:hypothetical protein